MSSKTTLVELFACLLKLRVLCFFGVDANVVFFSLCYLSKTVYQMII